MDIHVHVHKAAMVGDLSALQDAISRGQDVNSVKVSWFVGMRAEAVKVFLLAAVLLNYRRIYNVA